MKRIVGVAVAIVVLCAAVYATIFPIAEIFTEIVVLRTYDAGGSPHETRLTVIDIEGAPWVRGRPHRGWFRRVEANPLAELRRGGIWRPVRASIFRDPAAAAAFDRAMFETYGTAYRYVDFVARLSANEIPVRLVAPNP